MATVYIGRWTGAGGFTKVVAVKTLHPHLATDPRLCAMLRDEARMVSRIRHPGVLPIVDVIEERGEVFMVMDYVHGATLSQLCRAAARRQEPIAIDVALRVMSDALHGLHAAHDAVDGSGRPLDIVHRDVSPQNILLSTDGHAQLIDFGVAHALGRATNTRTGEIKGKLAYLAPEQILGDGISRRTDVYGASVVLWQLLTGTKLFDHDNFGRLAHAILEARVEPPSQLRDGISRELDELVLKGLARDPDARWASAAAMADAIDGLGLQAPRRRVGAWVTALSTERLAVMAELVSAVENAPPADPHTEQGTRGIPFIPPPDVEVSQLSQSALPQPSRTQLTSQAEATPVPPKPAQAMVQWVAALGIVSLAGAIWFTALSRSSDATASGASAPVAPLTEPAPQPEAQREEAPPEVASAAAPTGSANAAPQGSAAVAPAESAAAAEGAAPPARKAPNVPRVKPPSAPTAKLPRSSRWLPDDI